MTNGKEIEGILATLTSTSAGREHLERIIRDLLAARGGGERRAVGLAAVVGALLEGTGLTEGPERARAYYRLRDVIPALVAQMEGLQYVHSEE